MGHLLGFIAAFHIRKDVKGFLDAFGRNVLMQRNEAGCDSHREWQLN